jgi:hypothetical protein
MRQPLDGIRPRDDRPSFMLPGDDVIDLERNRRKRLREAAVLT